MSAQVVPEEVLREQQEQSDALYRCRGCRKLLFSSGTTPSSIYCQPYTQLGSVCQHAFFCFYFVVLVFGFGLFVLFCFVLFCFVLLFCCPFVCLFVCVCVCLFVCSFVCNNPERRRKPKRRLLSASVITVSSPHSYSGFSLCSDNVIPHAPGIGQEAFSWYCLSTTTHHSRNGSAHNATDLTYISEARKCMVDTDLHAHRYRRDRSIGSTQRLSCNSLFLEPMAWMGIVGNYEVAGKLACPCGYDACGKHRSVVTMHD
eukprot:COSAG05_NODE_2724_length_2726_cov_1.567568_1_plen_258_part_00